MQQIKITVTKQGQTTVEAEGFQGQACTEKTREILEALGPKRDDQKKPDFYQEEAQTQELSQ